MNRREFLTALPFAGATAGICTQIVTRPVEKPEKLEPGQVWKHKPGVNVIIIVGREFDGGHDIAEFWPDWDDGKGVLLTGEDCGASDQDILRSFDYWGTLADLVGKG